MSIEVRVPSTGNAGEDAVVVEWHVAIGDAVAEHTVLVTLETAKSTVDVEASAAGHLLAANFAVGDEAPEHAVLAVIGDPSEQAGLPQPPVVPVAAKPAAEAVVVSAPTTATDRRSAKASPRAALMAARKGLDLAAVTGSGPGGRIIIRDVMGAPAKVVAPAPVVAAAADEVTVVPVRGARKVTAQRMQASLQEAAQVTLTRYADADALLSFAARLRTVTEAQGLPRIGINELVCFAVARAVARHPQANATFAWEGIRQYRSVHLGMAVDTGQALLVPVIRNADNLSLGDLAAAMRVAIDKARSGSLTTDEMDGGTFTVTNLGGLGVHWFTPVLNPPQACVLGVGATHRLHPKGSSLLPLSLTFDHRALDGAAAAAALAAITEAIASVDVLSAL